MNSAHSAEHITVLTILWVVLAMAAKDVAGTFLMVAEARGRGLVAGLMDGAGDLTNAIVNVVGAGSVILYGWNVKTGGILAAMTVTSILGTWYWTKLSNRLLGEQMHTHPELAELHGQLGDALSQISVLETRLSALES